MKYIDFLKTLDTEKSYGTKDSFSVIVSDCEENSRQHINNIVVQYRKESYDIILDELRGSSLNLLAFFTPETDLTEHQEETLFDLTHVVRSLHMPFTLGEKEDDFLFMFDIAKYLVGNTYKTLKGERVEVMSVLNVGSFRYSPVVVFTVSVVKNKLRCGINGEYCLPIKEFLEILYSYGVPDLSDCLRIDM